MKKYGKSDTGYNYRYSYWVGDNPETAGVYNPFMGTMPLPEYSALSACRDQGRKVLLHGRETGKYSKADKLHVFDQKDIYRLRTFHY